MTRSDQATNFHNFLARVEEKVLKPDLLKDPVGNNFRAISEAAILEAINPICYEYAVDYSIKVLNSNLITKEQDGKLLFVATCEVRIEFFVNGEETPIAYSEALGMGLDGGDKAMGKAYTYAVKYALLKKLRLLYADDTDFTKSEKIPVKKAAEEEKKPSKGKSTKKEEKTSEEPLITEKMTNYIVGLMKEAGMERQDFYAKYKVFPNDPEITMKSARKIIDELKALIDDLPF